MYDIWNILLYTCDVLLEEYIPTIINKLLYTFDELLEEYIATIIPHKM